MVNQVVSFLYLVAKIFLQIKLQQNMMSLEYVILVGLYNYPSQINLMQIFIKDANFSTEWFTEGSSQDLYE